MMVKEKKYEFICENVAVLYDKMFPLYIVKGEKNFLIDSGAAAKAEDFSECVNKMMEETGEKENEKIDTLLLTHSHWDHTGGAYYLQQKYDFNVICSLRTVKLLQSEKVVTTINYMNREFVNLMKLTSDIRFDYLESLEALGEGDIIEVSPGRYFEVIETPGHTKCSISFFLHPEKILFPGDSVGLMEQNGYIRPLFFSNYTAYEGSLKKIINLDAEILAFPHNKVLKGKEKVKRYLEKSLARTQSVKDDILKSLKIKKDVSRVAEAIYKKEFPGISFMGPREVLMFTLVDMVKAVAIAFPGE